MENAHLPLVDGGWFVIVLKINVKFFFSKLIRSWLNKKTVITQILAIKKRKKIKSSIKRVMKKVRNRKDYEKKWRKNE
jgi:hypothetical protein